MLRPFQCTSQSNFDGASLADTTIFKKDSRAQKGLLEAINKEAHSATKSETSNDMNETVLHTAETGNYTEKHTRIDRESYQTTPNRVQRRKGSSSSFTCCKAIDRAAAAGGSLGSHAIDGPNLAFWAGVGTAILFQISAILVLG